MKDIEFLKRRAKFYDLEADYVNNNTLKLYSKKFNFDSWLIIENEAEFELWHQSKNFGVKNICYHLQKSVPKEKKIWMLQRIKSHNNYVAFNKYKGNLVDRIMSKEVKKVRIN